MMTARKKKPNSVLLTILAFILLILLVLKFDAVSSLIDPNGKLGIAGFVDDSFPILLGIMLIVIGIAAAASVWVAIALIAVGVVMIASKSYSIYKRMAPGSISNSD